MGIVDNALMGASGQSGYNLTRSLRFRASASATLTRTPASTTNQTTWTWSGWVKRGKLGSSSLFRLFSAGTYSTEIGITFQNDNIQVYQYSGGGFNFNLITTPVYRDPSSWYHIVVAYDSTQATSSNRIKIYVNGVQVTAFGTASYPSLNYAAIINSTVVHYYGFIGGAAPSSEYFDGYVAETNFIDGQALTPSSFGSTNALTGVWQPARYTGTYGTNGFYLPFTDNSALTTSSNVGLGKDFSGNGNYYVTNNISVTAGVTYDSMTDVPTLTSATAANFAVLNPVSPNNFTLTNGNLSAFKPSVGAQTYNSRSTIAVNSGKWYVEFTVVGAITGAGSPMFGITNPANSANSALASFSNTFLYYGYNGFLYNNGSGVAYGATFGANDVIGIALNLDAGTLTFYKNNVSQGVATSSIAGQTFVMLVNDDQGLNSWTAAANFGQRPFAYTPPSGFVALNTFNLPTSTIVKGNTVMDATLYTGTGASLSVTNAASFKPDLVWLKSRSNATDHKLTDSVRGVTKALASNSTNAETTDTQGLTAFNSNGFTLGTDANYNGSGRTFVGWQWQAGQGSTSSNTNGSITSTVSVNASAGFSVVTFSTPLVYTNATVGHGLGVTPAMFIVKNRNGAANINWNVYHQSLGNTQAIYLNLSNAATTSSTFWNNTSPTSSVFTVGANLYNSSDMVAYCWTPIAGYSAFGSYTGNGSSDGPFIYLGFRPKYVMIKRTDSGQNWVLYDTARNPYNVTDLILSPNAPNAEASGISFPHAIDCLSNGFKTRNYDATYGPNINASGGSYAYICFAENPFKNALAR